MIINRVKAGPSRHTFTIKPIKQLVKKYACSVCATNRAFGIENKEKNGVDE